MTKKYQSPEFECKFFDLIDVICSSPLDPTGGEIGGENGGRTGDDKGPGGNGDDW